ncbi:hypothetical protein [Lysinibacillus parviboronicapiens]|uniref:hypothetical protein n=1 Tax=Lysinibacillus parviboronicapiens TaxID=436516 RepID=UPI001F18EDF4|nr:hypothetical protein [Lysinibacillus parviboronicapiens]
MFDNDKVMGLEASKIGNTKENGIFLEVGFTSESIRRAGCAKKTIPSHQSSTSQLANYEQLELAISKLNKEIRVFERHFIMNIHPSNSVQHNII